MVLADGGTVCWPSSKIDDDGNSCPIDVDSDGACPDNFSVWRFSKLYYILWLC